MVANDCVITDYNLDHTILNYKGDKFNLHGY